MKGRGSVLTAFTVMAAALAACGSDDQAAAIDGGRTKPANVLLIVDGSGAMVDAGRLDRVRDGLDELIGELPPGDRVGLASFSQGLRPVVPIAPVRRNRQRLRAAVDKLRAGGRSMLYDAVVQGYGLVRELARRTQANAVVVLAHAPDAGSATRFGRLRRLLAAQRGSGPRVRVFTVGYDSADGSLHGALALLAQASGGQPHSAGADDVEPVLRTIWSEL